MVPHICHFVWEWGQHVLHWPAYVFLGLEKAVVQLSRRERAASEGAFLVFPLSRATRTADGVLISAVAFWLLPLFPVGEESSNRLLISLACFVAVFLVSRSLVQIRLFETHVEKFIWGNRQVAAWEDVAGVTLDENKLEIVLRSARRG